MFHVFQECRIDVCIYSGSVRHFKEIILVLSPAEYRINLVPKEAGVEIVELNIVIAECQVYFSSWP